MRCEGCKRSFDNSRSLDADADDVAPIIEALAPRGCERLYPMPD